MEYELPKNCTDDFPCIEERLAEEETAFLIHKFLHQMEEPYKEVFNLRVFGELPFEKIALFLEKAPVGPESLFTEGKNRL